VQVWHKNLKTLFFVAEMLKTAFLPEETQFTAFLSRMSKNFNISQIFESNQLVRTPRKLYQPAGWFGRVKFLVMVFSGGSFEVFG